MLVEKRIKFEFLDLNTASLENVSMLEDNQEKINFLTKTITAVVQLFYTTFLFLLYRYFCVNLRQELKETRTQLNSGQTSDCRQTALI